MISSGPSSQALALSLSPFPVPLSQPPLGSGSSGTGAGRWLSLLTNPWDALLAGLLLVASPAEPTKAIGGIYPPAWMHVPS